MANSNIRQEALRSARRIVVKLGTALLTKQDGTPDARRIGRLVDQVAVLHRRGCEVTIVSSGAIGAGMGLLGLQARPSDVPRLQALASVGQAALMRMYERALVRHGLHAGQLLVTRSDFEHRVRYLNIRNTLAHLHEINAVPIVNENDSTAVDEIRFGENDILAALLSNVLEADALVLLTVVDGVLRDGQVVELIDRIDDEILALVSRGTSRLGSGGMASKLEAVRIITEAGAVAVIANGLEKNVLLRLLDGERLGTVFVPSERKMRAKARWIKMAARSAGKIFVDAGAARAVASAGRSLLPIGVVKVMGRFERGDVVQVMDQDGTELARGLVNYSADELNKIKGLRSDKIVQVLGQAPYEEAIHRNNLVLSAHRRR